MPKSDEDRRRVSIHLTAQATIEFRADQLWPRHGEYARFGSDLDAFAEEITRRLRNDAYIGCLVEPDHIMVIPLAAIKRLDFTAY